MSGILGITASSRRSGGLPVAGASLWLDADDATTFTYSSGTVVSQWTDKSTNAYQFTNSSTSAQPSRSGTQNSKSTVVFDGSNDTLYESTKSKSLFNYFHNGAGATLFVVKKLNSTASAEQYVIGTCTDPGGQRGFTAAAHYPPTTDFYGGIGTGTANAYVFQGTSTYTNNTWEIRSYKLDANNATTANKMPMFLNLGAQVNSTIGPSWSSASSSNAAGWLGLGAVNDGTNIRYYFTGQVAEIIAYPSVLNNTDKDSVVNYLKTKWGI